MFTTAILVQASLLLPGYCTVAYSWLHCC